MGLKGIIDDWVLLVLRAVHANPDAVDLFHIVVLFFVWAVIGKLHGKLGWDEPGCVKDAAVQEAVAGIAFLLGLDVDDDFSLAATGQGDGKADVKDDTSFAGDFVLQFIIDDFSVGEPRFYKYMADFDWVCINVLFNYRRVMFSTA